MKLVKTKGLYIAGGLSLTVAIWYLVHFLRKKKIPKLEYSEIHKKELIFFEEIKKDAQKRIKNIEITHDNQYLSSITIKELYRIILETAYHQVVFLTAHYRSIRRQNFHNIEQYLNCYKEYSDELAELISNISTQILASVTIDEVYWIESVEYNIGQRDFEIIRLTKDWMNMFEKQRIPSKTISFDEYKQMLTIFCDSMDNDKVTLELFNKVPLQTAMRMKLHRAWDKVYFKLGLEEEDMNGIDFKPTEELRLLRGKYFMTLSILQGALSS